MGGARAYEASAAWRADLVADGQAGENADHGLPRASRIAVVPARAVLTEVGHGPTVPKLGQA